MKYLILLLSFYSQFLFAEIKTVIIAGDNWCPINCSAEAEKQGFMIDVARKAFAKSGYQLEYLEMPWTRAIGLARKGEIHGVVGAFKGDAPDFHFPQFPLLKISPNSLFTLKESDWLYNDLRSLNKVVLGVIKGYDYGPSLNNYINSHTSTDSGSVNPLYGNDAVKRSIEFLIRKRIDVFVETGPVFWYQAKLNGVDDLVKEVGSISPEQPCFIAFSPNKKESENLALILDKGVIELKQGNELMSIATEYGLPKKSFR